MSKRILVAGSTGFIGSKLHPVLVEAGYEVSGATRSPDRASTKHPKRTFVKMDTSDADTVAKALEGASIAYYLVHAMGDSDTDYEAEEARSAETFLRESEKAGVERLVYLGGIKPDGEASKHLRSRLRTGEILRSGKVSTIELRAAMIVGSDSASWQIVRDLATRLPLMVLPKWLKSRSEPVWVGDVIAALVHAADDGLEGSAHFDLPGPNELAARDILLRIANLQGNYPKMLEVPLVTPKLSSYWIALVTRADPHLAAELVKGLRTNILAHPDEHYWSRLESYQTVPFEEAARRALTTDEAKLPWSVRTLERLVSRNSPKPDSN